MNTLMKLYLLHEGRTQRVWDMRPGQSYLVGGSTSNDIVIDRRLCHWDSLCEVEAQPGRLVVTAVFDGPSIEGPKGAAQLVALRNFETAGVGSLRLGAVEQPLAFDWSEGESGQELLPTAADLGVVPAEKKLLVFELLDGKGGRLYQVKHGFLLGRVKTDNGIRFQNLAVSARHALVEERRDGFYLIDDSTHGTWINGVHYPKGVPVKLEKGMKIQLSPGGLVPLIEVHEAADLVRGRSGSPIVGESPATLAIVTRVRQMCTAGGRRRFLVLGAPGTGKELVGDEVARWVNARKEKVVCDCSTLPPTIIESELFGTVPGAFTDAVDRPGLVEAAAGGVLYLDEIGDMPLALQPKLLRLLEKGDFHRAGETKLRTADCVVVAATNRDLEAMVLAGTFRKDLHDRLKMGTVVHLQPLAERKQDILPIAASYLARREGRSHPSLSREAAYALVDHDWPGNVRELLGVVEVAAARTDGAEIEAATIREVIAEQRGPAGNAASPREALPRNVPERLRALERQLVEEGFNLYGRRWHTAAKKLGYAPSTFKRRVIEFGLLTREEADRQEKEGD
jgi:DNA-binding NtrC family response regulator